MSDTPGHEGHDHGSMPPLSPAIIERLKREVAEAKVINNLFLIPMGGEPPLPPRFIMTQVDEDGTIHTLGYIPFDFMLDVGIGFISAVRNAVQLGMSEATDAPSEGEGESEEPPSLAGGLFKVI